MLKRRSPSKAKQDHIYLKSTKNCPKTSILRTGDFSARVLELEIIIEMQNFEMSVVHELIELYNNAIDYYMLVGSPNYMFFKNRLKALFLKPRVIKALKKAEIRKLKSTNTCPESTQRDHLLTVDGRLATINEEISYLASENGAPERFNLVPSSHMNTERDSIDSENSPEKTLEFELKMQSFNMDKEVNTVHQKESIKQFLNNLTTSETVKEDIVNASMVQQRDRFIERLRERRNFKRNLSQNRSSNEITHSDSVSFEMMIHCLKETDQNFSVCDLNGFLNNVSTIKEEVDSPKPGEDKLKCDAQADLEDS